MQKLRDEAEITRAKYDPAIKLDSRINEIGRMLLVLKSPNNRVLKIEVQAGPCEHFQFCENHFPFPGEPKTMVVPDLIVALEAYREKLKAEFEAL